MSCRQTRLLLNVRREWTPREQAQADRHLSGCPVCQAMEREYQLMDLRLNRLPEPSVAPALPSTMRAHLFSGQRNMTIGLPSVPRWTFRGVALIAGAVLILLTVLARQDANNLPSSIPDSKGAAPSAVLLPTPCLPWEPGGLLWPASGRVSQGYSASHPALDISSRSGTPVYAIADGVVLSVREDDDRFGIHILLEHGEGYTSFYAHLGAATVKVGESVMKGQKIGIVGQTGLSTGPHLHFEIREDGIPANPLEHIEGTERSDEAARATAPMESSSSEFLWPSSGQISQGHSTRHRALDIANYRGTTIYAITDGTAVLSGQNSKDGIHILLDHSEGYTSFYSHLEVALVEIGTPVEQGQVIGLMGTTGLSTGPHLHFQIRRDGELINPLEVLPEK
jgi:murein DD-endopeptidase MepM/ murein hydrolase activator NlpD